MIDMAADVIAKMRLDVQLMALVDSKVYTDRVPDEVDAPFLVARMTQLTPMITEPGGPMDVQVQVDILGLPETEAEVLEAARRAADLLWGMTATRGMVTDSTYHGVSFVDMTNFYDSLYSPARPRWVLVTRAVARD